MIHVPGDVCAQTSHENQLLIQGHIHNNVDGIDTVMSLYEKKGCTCAENISCSVNISPSIPLRIYVDDDYFYTYASKLVNTFKAVCVSIVSDGAPNGVYLNDAMNRARLQLVQHKTTTQLPTTETISTPASVEKPSHPHQLVLYIAVPLATVVIFMLAFIIIRALRQ